MKYKIFEPPYNLAAWVKSYWVFESTFENTPLKNTIVPDGTMKLVFLYGDSVKHYYNEKIIITPKCFLLGQFTGPYILEPLGNTKFFIVQFQPNGLLPLVNIRKTEIKNSFIPLNEIFGKDWIEMGHQILKANSTFERIELFENFLLTYLSDKETIDNIVQSTIDTILDSNGKFSVNEFSKQNNINRRQLTRKFSSSVGLSPKQLSKIVRLHNTLKALVKHEVTSLTDLAYDNEYFDQAHFIKDFKEFTGLTPKEFYGDDLKLSMIFDSKD